MGTDTMIFLVTFGVFAVGSIALAIRLTGTRRRLKKHGIAVDATIDKQQFSHDMPTVYDLHFTTADGEQINKRLKGHTSQEVTHLVYDPDNPKRAWPPDKIFGTAATFQIGCLWILGIICALMFLIGITAF
jgi:hypothetical protein